MTKPVLMQGNEAVVEGAIAAGMRFFAGYPITPSTEIAERCALRLPQEGGKFIQMEDELASIAAVLGASAAGMKAMTATSGPGFSLMQENIGYGAMAEIPCVIVDVQRSGPSTGLPTSPSHFGGLPYLGPISLLATRDQGRPCRGCHGRALKRIMLRRGDTA